MIRSQLPRFFSPCIQILISDLITLNKSVSCVLVFVTMPCSQSFWARARDCVPCAQIEQAHELVKLASPMGLATRTVHLFPSYYLIKPNLVVLVFLIIQYHSDTHNACILASMNTLMQTFHSKIKGWMKLKKALLFFDHLVLQNNLLAHWQHIDLRCW